MAQKKYYNVAETAALLGISEDQVKRMHNDRKLTGYRDGADWKFRVEDVDKLAEQGKPSPEDEGDVLLSEEALGESGPGTSGTVIGPGGEKAADSDIQLASDSDLGLASTGEPAQQDDLDQVLDDELSLEDSGVKLGEEAGEKPESPSDSGATVDLSGEPLEDDDLVLGGSGTGSDITLGGDSGISLVDPADSGLSLEEPLELGGGGDEALELEEDDMLTFDESGGGDEESPTELKTDEDFLLQPSAEEEEEMESDSQVIPVEAAETPAASGEEMFAEAAPLLDEAAPTETFEGFDEAAAGAPAAPGFGAGLPAEGPAVPQTKFGLGSVLFMGLCVIPVLALTGVMMADLLRNMWSWESTSSLSSPIMDAILGLIDKK